MKNAQPIPFTIEDYNKLVVEAKTHTVKTRKGAPIVLFTVKANGRFNVVGQRENNDDIDTWADGIYDPGADDNDSMDLFLSPLPPKSIGWMNIYDEAIHLTRDLADQAATDRVMTHFGERIACIEVFEGMGLDDEPTSTE